MLKWNHPLKLKRKDSKHGKRVEAYKGGKSKQRQQWDYMIKRGMLNRYLRQRVE